MTQKKTFKFEHVTCIKVKDGDTIVVMIDQGFSTYRKETIRFLEFDSPETSKRGGASAAQVVRGKMVKGWLTNEILDQPIELEVRKISEDDDVYGRYLAWVWYKGENLNKRMYDMGFNKTDEEYAEMGGKKKYD